MPAQVEQGKVGCVEISQGGSMEKKEAINLALLGPEEMGGTWCFEPNHINLDCTRARTTAPPGAKHKENVQDIP